MDLLSALFCSHQLLPHRPQRVEEDHVHPPGFVTVTPYFFVKDAEHIIEFLVKGLGGTETVRSLRPDGPSPTYRFALDPQRSWQARSGVPIRQCQLRVICSSRTPTPRWRKRSPHVLLSNWQLPACVHEQMMTTLRCSIAPQLWARGCRHSRVRAARRLEAELLLTGTASPSRRPLRSPTMSSNEHYAPASARP